MKAVEGVYWSGDLLRANIRPVVSVSGWQQYKAALFFVSWLCLLGSYARTGQRAETEVRTLSEACVVLYKHL